MKDAGKGEGRRQRENLCLSRKSVFSLSLIRLTGGLISLLPGIEARHVWMLRTTEDAKQPFLFRITPGNIKTMGRATRADFVVDAALVSRLHCRLAAGAGEIEAVDLESTNGTYVNGERVARAMLKDGDKLRVGAVELVVVRTGVALQRTRCSGTGWSASPARSSSASPWPE